MFSCHNTHLEDAKHFAKNDPHLKRLSKLPLIHIPALLQSLPTKEPGIYSIGGARQIGKTTVLKQWMERLLKQGVAPEQIYFMTGELIDDQHRLVHLVQEYVSGLKTETVAYLLLDEITYIKDWDKGVKYLADSGTLENIILIITGSDLVFIQEARMRFPGRRGRAAVVDFHLYPLSFRDTVLLKHKLEPVALEHDTALLQTEFEHYLIHGGFLTAINDWAKDGHIATATFNTYMDWIRGDMLRRGKQEHYLREVLKAISDCYGSQITWNALAQHLSIEHPQTVADYIALLCSMDVLYVQEALRKNTLSGAPKTARKVGFVDPFIYRAVLRWLDTDPKSDMSSRLTESCVVSHIKRHYPTYYIKAEGEVGVAYIDQKKFWPIEVKWTNQLRPKDIKQVLKYPNTRVWSKFATEKIGHVQVEQLSAALFKFA